MTPLTPLTSPAERGSVQNLKVTEESAQSFRVSWRAAPGGVVLYRVFYGPVRDGPPQMETVTAASELTTVLQNLQPRTTYHVTVTPHYQGGAGAPQQTEGTTKEG